MKWEDSTGGICKPMRLVVRYKRVAVYLVQAALET